MERLNKMRQIIIIIFLSVFVTNAAPLNRKIVETHLNKIFLPHVGNLTGFTIEETLEVLVKLSNNKINFLYLPQLGLPPKPPQLVNTNGFGVAVPIGGLGVPVFPPNGGVPLPNNGVGIDPATGMLALPQPIPQLPAVKEKDPEMSTLTGDLKNLTLKQLLDVIEMGMNPPVQYIIMDWGVVFIQRDKNKPFMPTRIYRLNIPFNRGLK